MSISPFSERIFSGTIENFKKLADYSSKNFSLFFPVEMQINKKESLFGVFSNYVKETKIFDNCYFENYLIVPLSYYYL